jgi:hypothetical protein
VRSVADPDPDGQLKLVLELPHGGTNLGDLDTTVLEGALPSSSTSDVANAAALNARGTLVVACVSVSVAMLASLLDPEAPKACQQRIQNIVVCLQSVLVVPSGGGANGELICFVRPSLTLPSAKDQNSASFGCGSL